MTAGVKSCAISRAYSYQTRQSFGKLEGMKYIRVLPAELSHPNGENGDLVAETQASPTEPPLGPDSSGSCDSHGLPNIPADPNAVGAQERAQRRSSRKPVTLPALAGLQRINVETEDGWVYFLLGTGGTVLYVGQTENLISRLLNHPYRWRCTSGVAYVRAPLPKLDGVEAVFIAAFQPPLNSDLPYYDHRDVSYVVSRYFNGREADLPNRDHVRSCAVTWFDRPASRRRKLKRTRKVSRRRKAVRNV